MPGCWERDYVFLFSFCSRKRGLPSPLTWNFPQIGKLHPGQLNYRHCSLSSLPSISRSTLSAPKGQYFPGLVLDPFFFSAYTFSLAISSQFVASTITYQDVCICISRASLSISWALDSFNLWILPTWTSRWLTYTSAFYIFKIDVTIPWLPLHSLTQYQLPSQKIRSHS